MQNALSSAWHFIKIVRGEEEWHLINLMKRMRQKKIQIIKKLQQKKRHNQILEGAYDYKDEFESKVENSEGKEAQDTKENQKKSDGSEKPKMFERIKDFFSKEKVKEADKTDKTEENEDSEPKKGRKEEFMDRIKVTQSPEEIKKYNAEHGDSGEIKDRPKGGFERERTLGGESPNKYEAMDDSSDNAEES